MRDQRFLRGLLGAALTWGLVGAGIATAIFLATYQPWAAPPGSSGRALQLWGMFLGAGSAWGAACGLAFGVVVRIASRRLQADRLSTARFVLWGALAGAAFPLAIYVPVVISRAAYDAIPFFGGITAVSALLGAGFARLVVAVARRAPAQDAESLQLGGALGFEPVDMKASAHEHVR